MEYNYTTSIISSHIHFNAVYPNCYSTISITWDINSNCSVHANSNINCSYVHWISSNLSHIQSFNQSSRSNSVISIIFSIIIGCNVVFTNRQDIHSKYSNTIHNSCIIILIVHSNIQSTSSSTINMNSNNSTSISISDCLINSNHRNSSCNSEIFRFYFSYIIFVVSIIFSINCVIFST